MTTLLPEVLYLTSRMPYPPHSGGQLREYELIRRLSRRARIHLWVVTQFPEDAEGIGTMKEICADVRMFPADPVTEGPAGVPARVWRQTSAASAAELARFLHTHPVGLVHVEGYYMTPHLPGGLTVPLVLVEENVEYLIDKAWETIGVSTSSHCSWQQAAQLEHAAWRLAQVCATVSQDDAEHMRSVDPGLDVRWSPDGADHLTPLPPDVPRSVDREPDEPLTVSFVGNFTYPPSSDAAGFLLERIWPQIAAAVPQARLKLAGIRPGPALVKRAAHLPRVEVTGWVDRVADVLDESHVFVAPLRAGGGVKVKVLEAIARGCPIVTTPVGAQGLPPEVRDALVVCDEENFAANLVKLLEDRALRREMSTRIRSAARLLPTWDEAARRLWRIWSAARDATARDRQPGTSYDASAVAPKRPNSA
ncbi:glycosyltransferase [Streptomyces sp. SS8]